MTPAIANSEEKSPNSLDCYLRSEIIELTQVIVREAGVNWMRKRSVFECVCVCIEGDNNNEMDLLGKDTAMCWSM